MKILVVRMSAMGDVAMTVPVVKQLLKTHPDLELVYLSQDTFRVFFDGIDRLEFISPDLDGEHKGIVGMYKLYKQLKKDYQFDAIADLHGVLRSEVLTFFFKMYGTKVATIDKGKKRKRKLTRYYRKRLKPLKVTSERYADVFRHLGLKFDLDHQLVRRVSRKVPPLVLKEVGVKAGPWIGIAPFAQHKGKKYRFDKVAILIGKLQKTYPKSKIFLFGGGENEVQKLKGLWDIYPQTILAAGKMNLQEELNLMSNLNVMISMDSANMHMASLMGTKVVSVWGSTHPYAGFMGYGQKLDWAAQIDLECRPCSVFGNKECHRKGKDYACMANLPEDLIVDKVKLIVPVEEVEEE